MNGVKNMQSVVVDDTEHCVVCGSPYIHIHHVFFGTANRKISDKFGYVIPLCQMHHTAQTHGIHFNKDLDIQWKRICQQHFESNTGNREAFIALFGRSYM